MEFPISRCDVWCSKFSWNNENKLNSSVQHKIDTIPRIRNPSDSFLFNCLWIHIYDMLDTYFFLVLTEWIHHMNVTNCHIFNSFTKFYGSFFPNKNVFGIVCVIIKFQTKYCQKSMKLLSFTLDSMRFILPSDENTTYDSV